MDSLSTKRFFFWFLLICSSYVCIQFFLNAHVMFSVDDFWFAHRSYDYKEKLPYRDFLPYKTTLGYYFLLIPMLAVKGAVGTLIYTKNVIMLVNIIACAITAAWLQRYFSRIAILLSFILILFSDTVLSTSNDIRADLLGYWFSLFCLLSLLEKRYVLAGLFLGIGFFITQKVIWYWFASNVALFSYCLYIDRRNFKAILLFNLSIILMIIAYLAFWSYISNWHTVINSVFGEAAIMYKLDTYAQFRKIYWAFITTYNPLLFLWPLTVVSLFISFTHDTTYNKRFFITVFSLTILLLLIPYKQLFPYYLQISIPILLVLFSAFFTWLMQLFTASNLHLKIHLKWVGIILLSYSIIIFTTIISFSLPLVYAFLLALPLLLFLYVFFQARNYHVNTNYFSNLSFAIIFLIGTICPGILLFKKTYLYTDGAYQKANIAAVNQLLKESGDYVAGVELIYNRNQPINGLKHLMIPAIDYLSAPSDKLRPVMLTSLDEDPTATANIIIHTLENSLVKFYVNNYRIQQLPSNIKNYLHLHYAHWAGSIYLYAPHVAAGKQHIKIKFSGNYLIDSPFKGNISLNGRKRKIGSTITLMKGTYLSKASMYYRLKLIYNTNLLPDKFKADQWNKMI